MADHRTRLLHSAGSMAAMTTLSRITGYFRDSIQALILGAANSSDAFIVAYRIPNLLRRLVGEGAMTAAFVPVFAEIESRTSREEVWRFSGQFFNALAVVLAGLCAAGIAFAPWVVRAFAFGFTGIEGKETLTIHLTRLMFPYLFFIGLSALEMAILNSLDRFALPASTPLFLNLAIIGAALAFARRIAEPADAFGWGVLFGGFLQMAVLFPALWRAGLRLPPAFGFRHPGIRRVLLLMLPGVFGAGIYQINLVIDTLFASFQPSGSVSYLYFSNRITELVVGVHAVSLSTALLPTLSRDVLKESATAVRDTLDFGMRQIAFATLPACAGLIALGVPIVHVLFERGRFDASATRFTAEAMAAYALGLFPVSALKIMAPAFYARQNTRTPVWVGFWTLILHIALNFALVPLFPGRPTGIALSTSLSAMFNLLALSLIYRRRWGPAWGAEANFSIVRCTVASLGMAAACWGALEWSGFYGKITLAQLLILGAVILLGASLYLSLLWLLRAPEPGEMLAALRSRRRPRL
jgi:putative peptidoglycan lipid II flippase